jgi:hypothetical protein
MVASCRVGMVGVSGDLRSMQPGGFLPDSGTVGVEAFSPPPPRVCLLPFRLRLWIPAWDLGLRHSATGTESYLYQLDPQLRATLTGEGKGQPLMSSLLPRISWGACAEYVVSGLRFQGIANARVRRAARYFLSIVPLSCAPQAARKTMGPSTGSLRATGNDFKRNRSVSFIDNEECTPANIMRQFWISVASSRDTRWHLCNSWWRRKNSG